MLPHVCDAQNEEGSRGSGALKGRGTPNVRVTGGRMLTSDPSIEHSLWEEKEVIGMGELPTVLHLCVLYLVTAVPISVDTDGCQGAPLLALHNDVCIP